MSSSSIWDYFTSSRPRVTTHDEQFHQEFSDLASLRLRMNAEEIEILFRIAGDFTHGNRTPELRERMANLRHQHEARFAQDEEARNRDAQEWERDIDCLLQLHHARERIQLLEEDAETQEQTIHRLRDAGTREVEEIEERRYELQQTLDHLRATAAEQLQEAIKREAAVHRQQQEETERQMQETIDGMVTEHARQQQETTRQLSAEMLGVREQHRELQKTLRETIAERDQLREEGEEHAGQREEAARQLRATAEHLRAEMQGVMQQNRALQETLRGTIAERDQLRDRMVTEGEEHARQREEAARQLRATAEHLSVNMHAVQEAQHPSIQEIA